MLYKSVSAHQQVVGALEGELAIHSDPGVTHELIHGDAVTRVLCTGQRAHRHLSKHVS